MSSTRHALPGSPFRQERYASSPEYDRGLHAGMVARRCEKLPAPADRELVWFIQALSHHEGGLKALAESLAMNCRHLIGTAEMVKTGKAHGKTFCADEVKLVRAALPEANRQQFPLKGETVSGLVSYYFRRQERQRAELEGREDEYLANLAAEKETHPNAYPVAAFMELCAAAAAWPVEAGGISHLESFLRELCLNPAQSLHTGLPWYFARLDAALEHFKAQWVKDRAAGTYTTAIGRQIQEALDFSVTMKSLVLVEGETQIGKSVAAKAWCEQHLGKARYLETPPGNDDTTFFRHLARGLGLGNFSQYKAIDLRDRIEKVLRSGDLLLCLDAAHHLWGETNFRYGYAKRISWVMDMAKQGVPICLVATPQFLRQQRINVQNTGWNAEQFIGLIRGSYIKLPAALEFEDLLAVSRTMLPDAGNDVLEGVAAFAKTTLRQLDVIGSVAKRANYNARRANRDTSNSDDVFQALKSVIESQNNLTAALAASEECVRPAKRRQPVKPMQSTIQRERPAAPAVAVAGEAVNRLGDRAKSSPLVACEAV